jgi:DNA polymerase-3 subunit gamma/tau
VLSRCLQFNLKRFPPGLIFKRLTEITAAESIDAEPDALRLVARAAQGSMRDALSLLDQVIAFGGAKLSAADTRTMLGTLDRAEVFGIIDAVAVRDAKRVLACVAQLDERAPDYREVLAELAAVLQKVALVQAVPDLQLDEAEDIEAYTQLAAALTPEDTQLFYQVAVIGRRDLELAPDARGGFEMVLLRMLAFSVAESSGTGVRATTSPAQSPLAGAPASVTPSGAATSVPKVSSIAQATSAPPSTEWATIVPQLNLQGPSSQLAAHCVLTSKQGNHVKLTLDADGETFRRPALEDRLAQALSAYFGEAVKLEISAAADITNTPARLQKAAADDRMQAARSSIDNDPNIHAMRDIFGATVQPDSVRPNE